MILLLILNIFSSESLFDLAKFSNLHQLESLKLRGVSGISLPVFANPQELQNLSALIKLKNLVSVLEMLYFWFPIDFKSRHIVFNE